MTHPGVGPVTGLATEVFLGDPMRFTDGKAVASYIGIIPRERSSGRRQRLGKLSKEGNALVRYLWGEAAMHAVRRDPELKRFYRRKLIQKGLGKARAAAARKLLSILERGLSCTAVLETGSNDVEPKSGKSCAKVGERHNPD